MKMDLSLEQLRVLAEFARQNNDNDTIVQIRAAVEKIETASRLVKEREAREMAMASAMAISERLPEYIDHSHAVARVAEARAAVRQAEQAVLDSLPAYRAALERHNVAVEYSLLHNVTSYCSLAYASEHPDWYVSPAKGKSSTASRKSENSYANEIYDFVSNNPGCTSQAIEVHLKNVFGLADGAAISIPQKADGRVYRKGAGKSTVWYVSAVSPAETAP